MKDFDEARTALEKADRAFKIGGEEFVHRVAVAPDSLVPWNQAVTQEVKLTEPEWLSLYDSTIVLLLDPSVPGQSERWERVRDPDAPNPLTLSDMRAVLEHLIEVTTNRPTLEPSGSSNGSASTATTSKVASSSPVAEASAV